MLIGNMRQEIQQSIAKEQETTLRNAQKQSGKHPADASNTWICSPKTNSLRSLASLDIVKGNLYSLVGILRVLKTANEQRPLMCAASPICPQSGYLITDKSTYHPELADISTWDLGVDYKTLLTV